MREFYMDLVLLFAVYSFAGWLIETVFKSVRAKRLINSGFLTGPFCPIYGFGAVIIVQCVDIANRLFGVWYLNTLLSKLILSMLLATVLEYVTAAILERVFRCKWWDYSNEFLNIRGRVCLRYSVYWGILAYALIKVVHPVFSTPVVTLPLATKHTLATMILAYVAIDTLKSTSEFLNLRQVLFANHGRPLAHFSDKVLDYKRIYSAFPRLHFPRIGRLNQEIREELHDRFEVLKSRIKDRQHQRTVRRMYR